MSSLYMLKEVNAVADPGPLRYPVSGWLYGVCMHACVCVCVHTHCVCICMYVCRYIYTYTHIHIHTYIHTYIHICPHINYQRGAASRAISCCALIDVLLLCCYCVAIVLLLCCYCVAHNTKGWRQAER
jgi:hypothetical protein